MKFRWKLRRSASESSGSTEIPTFLSRKRDQQGIEVCTHRLNQGNMKKLAPLKGQSGSNAGCRLTKAVSAGNAELGEIPTLGQNDAICKHANVAYERCLFSSFFLNPPCDPRIFSALKKLLH